MDLTHADKLSHAARSVLDAGALGTYTALVVTESTRAPETAEVRRQLQALGADAMLNATVASREHADALLAGLWLRHDYLDESHTISQNLNSATGSFWHAIMHRREGDFSNAKYWYARCRNHPALAEIGSRIAPASTELGLGGGADPALERLVRGGPWDPDRFVDFVSRVNRQGAGPQRDIAVRLQQLEWSALFDHCILAAAGG